MRIGGGLIPEGTSRDPVLALANDDGFDERRPTLDRTDLYELLEDQGQTSMCVAYAVHEVAEAIQGMRNPGQRVDLDPVILYEKGQDH